MKPIDRIVCWVVILAACGDNERSVRVRRTELAPSLVLFRDGAASWRPPQVSGNNYKMLVTDTFQILSVVRHADGSFSSDELSGRPDEGGCWTFGVPEPLAEESCDDLTSIGAIPISGQMQQAGAVSVGGMVGTSATAPWQFTFEVLPGIHDIVATNAVGSFQNKKVLVRHDQLLAAGAMLSAIDLDVDGVALDSIPISVSGLDSDGDLSAIVRLTTTHDIAEVASGPLFASTTNAVPVVGDELLAPTDVQTVDVRSQSSSAIREANTILAGHAGVQIEFAPAPAVIYDVIGTNTVATWQVAATSGAALAVSAMGSSQRTVATAGWLADRERIEFDTDLPGYSREWIVDTKHAHTRDFALWQRDGSTTSWVAISSTGPQEPCRNNLTIGGEWRLAMDMDRVAVIYGGDDDRNRCTNVSVRLTAPGSPT